MGKQNLWPKKIHPFVGGELPLPARDHSVFYTDCGRSSLRLFLRHYKGLRIALPDFLCAVIVDVLKQEGVSFCFYPTDPHLMSRWEELDPANFDVLYRINYFGHGLSPLSKKFSEKIILDDHVFSLRFENNEGLKNWFGFNSYRKISTLAQGSLIKTNLEISSHEIHGTSPAASKKYYAKNLKFQYLYRNEGTEDAYLQAFNEGEQIFDTQSEIGRMDDESHFLLNRLFEGFDLEIKRRKENYQILEQYCQQYSLLQTMPEEPSFFILKTAHRDELRKHLFQKNIFLPIHWPDFGIKNDLYKHLLSVPVMGDYNQEEIVEVARTIQEFLSERSI